MTRVSQISDASQTLFTKLKHRSRVAARGLDEFAFDFQILVWKGEHSPLSLISDPEIRVMRMMGRLPLSGPLQYVVFCVLRYEKVRRVETRRRRRRPWKKIVHSIT